MCSRAPSDQGKKLQLIFHSNLVTLLSSQAPPADVTPEN
jgi:hypothetical protein